MKNTITMHPKDIIVLHTGIKIENVGEYIVKLDLPSKMETWKEKIEIKEIKKSEI